MIRVIIFCDSCNEQGIRYIEQKRSNDRGDAGGRRSTDGLSWHEGSLQEAVKLGWKCDDGEHICPRCKQKQ
jgi:hypothetical protein